MKMHETIQVVNYIQANKAKLDKAEHTLHSLRQALDGLFEFKVSKTAVQQLTQSLNLQLKKRNDNKAEKIKQLKTELEVVYEALKVVLSEVECAVINEIAQDFDDDLPDALRTIFDDAGNGDATVD